MYRTAIFAGLCGVSERTLERLMKSNYPSSPSSWLRTLQILDSIPLICRGKRIKAVAAEVYFQNPVLPEFPGDFALDDLREKKKGPGSF
jgi:AraC-like DNA-binding protein